MSTPITLATLPVRLAGRVLGAAAEAVQPVLGTAAEVVQPVLGRVGERVVPVAELALHAGRGLVGGAARSACARGAGLLGRGGGAAESGRAAAESTAAASAEAGAEVFDAAARLAERASNRVAPPEPPEARRAARRLAPEAVEVGAPGTASGVVEQVAEERAAERVASELGGAPSAGSPRTAHGGEAPAAGELPEPGEEPALDRVQLPDSSEDLPVPSWDTLALGTLRARTAKLPVDDLLVLLAWEREHAHRLQVVTMLENRIARQAGRRPTPRRR